MRRAAAAAIVALALLPSTALGQEAETNLSDIEDEVICLVCGTTLELSENAPQAERLREQIRGLINEGLTKEEIKDELVAEYGENVLATPEASGFNLTAWVLPGIALAIAAAAIAFGLMRRRRDEPPAAAPLDAGDAARVEEDLRSYDG